MMENVNDYDEVFEELHDKYGESVKMAPELKLISMVAGSGFMFHLTNSLLTPGILLEKVNQVHIFFLVLI